MIGVILAIILVGFVILIECSKPVLWAMGRLRILYPIAFLILGMICQGKDWAISKFLFFYIFGNIQVGDVLFVLICILSLYSLLKELFLSIKDFFRRGNSD